MQPRIPRLVMAAPMVAALAATVAASGGSAWRGPDTPALKSVSSRLDGTVSTVLIEATEPVAYLTSQPDPLTVLVDLRNVNAEGLDARPVATPPAPVAGVAIEGASAPDGSPVARVRVSLDRAAKHRVRSARNMILVEVERSGSPEPVVVPQLKHLVSAPTFAKATADKPAASRSVAGVTSATELRAIKTGEMPNGYAITLSGNGALVATSVEEAKDPPNRVLLDFHNVSAGRVAAVTAVNHADIERVRVGVNSREPLITRVVIDLARKIPYTVETVGDELRVLFNRAVEATAAVVINEPAPNPIPAPDPPAPVPAPAAAPARVEPPAAAAALPIAPAPVTLPTALAAAAVDQTPQPPTGQPQTMSSGAPPQRQFTGDPVTLDFQGADLRAVLRTFAEISNGLNIVIDPSINGTVDVSLRDVPWDQALDIILRANKLGYILEGNIVRIVPLNVLAQEREEQRKLDAATALVGDLRVLTRPLSYAKASELVPIVRQSALSSRGEVQIDARTNTLIIKDLADRLTAAAELITALDTPQRQVEIEARIVQSNRNFARELGIQWGFNGRIDPGVGTTTGLTFPNTANVGGRLGGTNPGGNPSAPTAVNLPAAGDTGIGLALGSVTGALNLDVALSALENSSKVRILSSPRVTTQNNVQAEIAQGQRVPVQTISNNTVTTTYVDAALTLRVTPQITAAGTVIMRIEVDNGSAEAPGPDGSRVINTQRAGTTVLVGDGDTTVIGGIYQNNSIAAESHTPGLGRIPLLKWLFRRDSTIEGSTELLIFITPRISK
jgi:type IV pilus secretin PilQ/predicted competence protein